MYLIAYFCQHFNQIKLRQYRTNRRTHLACILFRHLDQIFLDLRQQACVKFSQSDENICSTSLARYDATLRTLFVRYSLYIKTLYHNSLKKARGILVIPPTPFPSGGRSPRKKYNPLHSGRGWSVTVYSSDDVCAGAESSTAPAASPDPSSDVLSAELLLCDSSDCSSSSSRRLLCFFG